MPTPSPIESEVCVRDALVVELPAHAHRNDFESEVEFYRAQAHVEIVYLSSKRVLYCTSHATSHDAWREFKYQCRAYSPI